MYGVVSVDQSVATMTDAVFGSVCRVRDLFWCSQEPKFGLYSNGNKMTFSPFLKKKSQSNSIYIYFRIFIHSSHTQAAW